MYYDRRISPELLELIEPGGPLHWLVALVNSPWGAANSAHIQFRKDEKARTRGSIQVYLGRTAILEFLGRASGRVRLHAADSYKMKYGMLHRPPLFDTAFSSAGLIGLEAQLEEYLRVIGGQASQAFVGGEGESHGGMMRRYGPGYQPSDTLLAVESEVRCGFPSMVARDAFRAELSARLGISKGLPTKLDAIGVLDNGNIGLVEVKDQRGDMSRAVVQAAAHVATIGSLDRTELVDVLNGMMGQKVDAGLLPASRLIAGDARLVPVIAAPDTRDDWFHIWSKATVHVRQKHAALLHGLLFWKLSATGEILEERCP